MTRLPYYFLVSLLLIIGVSLCLHRALVLQVPWTPSAARTVWEIEATIDFKADGQPVKASLARPQSQNGLELLSETGASPGYGLELLKRNGNSIAEWTIRSAQGGQRLFYRLSMLQTSEQRDLSYSLSGSGEPPELPPLTAAMWDEPYATAIQQISDTAYQKSADAFSFIRQLLMLLQSPEPDQNTRLLLSQFDRNNLASLLTNILNSKGINAHTIKVLKLEDGRRRQELIPMLKVWEQENYQLFPLPGHEIEPSQPILVWQDTSSPVLDLSGGSQSSTSFSIIRRSITSQQDIMAALRQQDNLLNFSIHSLPLQEQAMFQTILLLPIGALVVCLLRIMVGLRTSGTFMPVLIALAFIQTQLITGLIGFLLVVSIGLILRSYLSRLNLLLVARISAVIVTVIAIIATFSVLSHQLGLTEGLKITFFPMIIMAWTIERMSILWEEEGWTEVAIRGGGSMLTAVIAYLIMNNPWVRHLAFNFIGLQFIIMAMILLLGSYNGYRLLELYRFRFFKPGSKSA